MIHAITKVSREAVILQVSVFNIDLILYSSIN